MSELKNRGVKDILIAAVDGLSGFPDAIKTAYPQTQVQLCIVHMIRNSVRFLSFKDRTAVTASLKPIYTAANEEQALAALDAFAGEWDARYPIISRSWKARWTEVALFVSYPEEICKAIYTTNAIESVNYSLLKVTTIACRSPTPMRF